MRLIHLFFTVILLAIIFTIARDQTGRVALVVFATTMGEVVFGTAAIMMLFQTFGAIGEARSPLMYAEAITATLAVLFVAAAVMGGLLYIGIGILQLVVR